LILRGELFEQTACEYRRAYRLDLIDPSRSDYWNFVPDCKGDVELAREVASIIVDTQPNGRRSSSKPFWLDTEIDALTAILLHLPHIVNHPTPPMIVDFISLRSIDPVEGKTESPLNEEMNQSPHPQVGRYWTPLTRAKRMGTILADLISKCRGFTTSTVKAVTSSFATPGSTLRARIELNDLREPGTAIYVRAPEGDFERLSAFLTTLFRLGLSVLSGRPSSIGTAPALLVFDEAVSFPIQGLHKILSSGRGSRVAAVLAFQSVGQIYDSYGRDDGYAVLSSINSMVFLSGLDRSTADFGARLAGWNATEHRVIDRKTKRKSRAERLAEVECVSLYAEEIRQLVRHKRAVALMGSAPPIKFLYPPFFQA
jgi:type IV secretory pathway TraG/TraD family ATPase VirD4